jgi:hypothetical protein
MVPGGARNTPRFRSRGLLRSLLGLLSVGGCGWGRGGSCGIGGGLLLALVLGELPVFDQDVETSAARAGLFVCPFVHAEFPLDEEFLALLDQLAEIFGGFTPDLEVDESSDLLVVPLSVSVRLVVCERRRQNSFCVRRVSEFRVSGEIADDENFVEIHSGDLGFRFDVVFRVNSCIRIDALTMLHVAYPCKQNIYLFSEESVEAERFVANELTLLRMGSSTRNTSPTCTRVSTWNLSEHKYEIRSLISVSIVRAASKASALSAWSCLM